MVHQIKKHLSPVKRYFVTLLARVLSCVPVSSDRIGPPKGYHVSGKSYAGLMEASGAASYIALFPERENDHGSALPITVDKELHWRFTKNVSFTFPEQYIISIRNGRVTGHNCLVISHDDKVIADVSREFGIFNQPAKMRIFRMLSLPQVRFVNRSVGVVGYAGSDNYWHWMFDVLPRLELLRRAQLLDKCEKIVINPLKLSYQKETIKIFNISDERFVFSDRQLHLRATELLVPSVPDFRENVPEWSVSFLRKSFLREKRNLPNKRIYISRKKARTRKVVNEAELLEVLRPLGFEVVELENMPVSEQAQLFNSSSIIVAPHGASQTNLIFCEPGTKVIELFSPLWVHYCFWSLSVQLNLQYYYLMGEGPFIAEENYRIEKDADIEIDMERFSRILVKAEILN